MRTYNVIDRKTGQYVLTSDGKRQVVSERTKLSYEQMFARYGVDTLGEMKFKLVLENKSNK